MEYEYQLQLEEINVAALDQQLRNLKIAGFRGFIFSGLLKVLFEEEISDEDKTLVDGVVAAHSPSDEMPAIPDEPKIYSLMIKPYSKHFHEVDHAKDLRMTLNLIETIGDQQNNRGLLLSKKYFLDERYTDQIFEVNYEWTVVLGGHITHRSLVLRWKNNDGSWNSDEKIKGSEKLSPIDSREANRNRRKSCVYRLEAALIEYMSAISSTPEEVEVNLATGAAFMAAVAGGINVFLESGVNTAITGVVTAPGAAAAYPFLAAKILPGVTVANFIVAGLTYE